MFFAPHLVKLTTREYTCYGLFCLRVKNVHVAVVAAVVISGGILCAEGFFIHVGWCLYCKIKRSDEETKAKGLSCCEA